MNLIKAMLTVGGMTGLSRIAGFARDILTAAIMGTGPVADAFFVALKLPNFFRRVTAEGAFSVSFVPVYSECLEKDGEKEAHEFALNVFYIMLYALGLLSILAVAVMPFVIHVVAPGFADPIVVQCAVAPCPPVPDERFDLAVSLSRITFPYLLLMSLTALLGGVLNAQGRFAPFAFAPVLFNVALIVALLLSNLAQTAGHAMAWGVLTAGFLQFGWMLLNAARAGFVLKYRKIRFDFKTRKVLKLMGPGVIGAGVMHINLFADLIIASFLTTGSISYLYYADRLNQLPLGVVGIAVGTVLLPMLSKTLSRGDHKEGRELFNRAMEYCMLLTLPAAAALATIPHELVGTLFERRAFTAEDTSITALVLTCYAIGLPSYIAVKIFSTAHWARQDTKTPVKISVAATITNVALSLLLIRYMGVAGIALGTGLTGWMQFSLHVRALKGHPSVVFDARFKRNIIRIALSTCAMVAVLTFLSNYWDIAAYEYTLSKFLALLVFILAGMISYGFCVTLSGVINIRNLKRHLLRG